jgi:hypothetical protein
MRLTTQLMRSSDLTVKQIEAVEATLRPAYDFLNKLLSRMQYKQFADDDEVWIQTLEAQRAMLMLMSALHRSKSGAIKP